MTKTKSATAPAPKLRALSSKRVDRSKPASVVIDKFGGLTRFCQLTGYPTSTAHGWTVSGYIPAQRKGVSTHQHIMGIAAANRISLKPGDFVDQAPAIANG